MTTAGRQRVEETAAAASRHPLIVTTEIPVLHAAGAYGSPRDWSALPDLPLSVVARRLYTLMDFLSFRCVCTSWRSVGRAVAEDVMASLPPLFFGGYVRHRFYHPGEKRLYKGSLRCGRTASGIAGVSHGFLILGFSGWVSIVNPLTGEEKDCFPQSRRQNIERALLSSPPTSPGCVIVESGRWSIQYCRPGDKEWCQVRWPGGGGIYPKEVLNVAAVGGNGYALIEGVGLGSFDLTPGRSTVMLTLLQDTVPDTRWYSSRFLAESNGQLFALPAIGYSGQFADDVPVVVCRFDASSSKWVVLDDLGGRTVLVDPWKSALFVDGFETWGGSKDCIYACQWLAMEGKLLKYELNDTTSDPPPFLFATLPADEVFGMWVLPRWWLSPFRLDG